jgi:hypothetical protein
VVAIHESFSLVCLCALDCAAGLPAFWQRLRNRSQCVGTTKAGTAAHAMRTPFPSHSPRPLLGVSHERSGAFGESTGLYRQSQTYLQIETEMDDHNITTFDNNQYPVDRTPCNHI